ncbi:hypothetical protein EJC47_01395 [Sphingomonas sp. TF3]|nr:hypothetical protein EJC47_01395 [Sphingomonas sp. TF3]
MIARARRSASGAVVSSPLPLAGGAGGGAAIGSGDTAAIPSPNPSRKREGDFFMPRSRRPRSVRRGGGGPWR